MSFIPGGYEDEDSDEDFVDFTKNCKVYDERVKKFNICVILHFI